MKRVFVFLICIGLIFSGCAKKDAHLKIGDKFKITGVVDYSDSPSDIGEEYCFMSCESEIEYYYIDIYGEESKWKSNTFYTKGADTAFLKEYVGETLTVFGTFDAECHGIPYITDIEIVD